MFIVYSMYDINQSTVSMFGYMTFMIGHERKCVIFRLSVTATQVDGEFYHAINPETTSVYLFKKLQALQNLCRKYMDWGELQIKGQHMRTDLHLFWIGYSNRCFFQNRGSDAHCSF